MRKVKRPGHGRGTARARDLWFPTLHTHLGFGRLSLQVSLNRFPAAEVIWFRLRLLSVLPSVSASPLAVHPNIEFHNYRCAELLDDKSKKACGSAETSSYREADAREGSTQPRIDVLLPPPGGVRGVKRAR